MYTVVIAALTSYASAVAAVGWRSGIGKKVVVPLFAGAGIVAMTAPPVPSRRST